MTQNATLFLPITKVDEAHRLVYGVAAAEERDNAGEIFDYATSKPYIQAWSDSFVEKTDGKSYGNLRAMHKPISAGKLTELTFDDHAKKVYVCAKVVDDDEWEKVEEGVYTGFSFGGHAVRKWHDAVWNGKRYTLNPNELSLGDKPCIPSATFEVVKVDGTVESRPFKERSHEMDPVVKKNFENVSWLASLLESLNYIRQSEAWQANQEGDTANAIPARLREAVDNLAQILVDMTAAEAEALTKIDIALAAKDTTPAAVAGSPQDVSKLDVAGEVAKQVAPIAEAVQKLTAGMAELGKTIDGIKGLGDRVAKLEDLPEPAKAIVKVVGKEDDVITATPAAEDKDALSVIKKIHQGGPAAVRKL